MVKVSRVIEAKNVSHVYYGWSNELKLTVEGGEVVIPRRGTVIASFTLESFSLDRLAELNDHELNDRIREFQRIARVE